jgi:hypothetical protein
MQTEFTKLNLSEVGVLLRGEPEPIRRWTERWDARRLMLHLALVLAGAGCYGATIGLWRAPGQALFTAIKFPLIILFTTIGNALLNAMLAPLLGLNIPFRQSFLAIVTSFALASVILGAFSPLTAFVVWNAPPMVAGARSGVTYSAIQIVHVAVIAFAGIAANLRLHQLLQRLAGSRRVATRVLLAWLGGNLFLGSQLSWILRPFIGSPDLPVQFLRETAFHGNFYESVFSALRNLFSP